MKNFFANLGINIVAICCVSAAAYMAINSKDGWGWFLVAGLMCVGLLVIENDGKDQSGQ